MPTTTRKKVTQRGENVIQLIKRFGLCTPQIAERALDMTANQVKGEMRRLRNAGLVDSHPFVKNQVYYRLTRSACRQFDVSRRQSEPLGPQAIFERFSVLHFAVSTRPLRRLLDSSDVAELLNCPDEAPLAGNFYLDVVRTEERTILRVGHILIDRRLEPTTLISKAQDFIHARRNQVVFRELVLSNEFMFAVLTESDGKKQSLINGFQEAGFRTPIRFHICSTLGLL